jgi:hypothetical protein
MIPRRPFGDRGDSISSIGPGGFHLGQTSSASAVFECRERHGFPSEAEVTL